MTDRLHPDLARTARWLPTVSFTRRNLRLVRLAFRVARPRRPSGGDVIVWNVVDAEVALRVYAPVNREPESALVWMHGGGLIVGAPEQDDARCVRFARELGILVVSPAYRLAPEFPFPAAHDDCYAAWRWAVRRAEAVGGERARVAVGGESAGGGLAASLTQRIHDEGGREPVAQLLIYPMLDDRTAAGEPPEPRPHLVWNRRSNRTGWSSYLAGAPGALEVPRYSVPARRDDLSGLAPAWIGVGTLDLFYEEDRRYAERLGRAGVRCRLDVVDGAFHGFESLAPRSSVSKEFADSQLEFLRARLVP